jgi:hypothetical protein
VWAHLVTGLLTVKVILLTPAFTRMNASLDLVLILTAMLPLVVMQQWLTRGRRLHTMVADL